MSIIRNMSPPIYKTPYPLPLHPTVISFLPTCRLILITTIFKLLRAFIIPTLFLSLRALVVVGLHRCHRPRQAQARPSIYLPLCPHLPICRTRPFLLLQAPPFFRISWASHPPRCTRALHFHSSAPLPLLPYWKVCICVTSSFTTH